MDRSLEGRGTPVGYRMIDRLKVQNFRCFEKIDVHPLSRVNVVVGDNASGKTAFLESIFLAAAGSPELTIRLRVWRGAEALQLTRERSSYEELWRELFYKLDDKRTISAESIGSMGNSRFIEVLYENGQVTLPLNGEQRSAADSPAIRLITFRGKDIAGHEFKTQPEITDKGFVLGMAGENVPGSFFPSTVRASGTETARRFSDVSKLNEQGPLIGALKKQFLFLENISVEVEGGQGLLFATVKGTVRKMRLGLASAGLERLVAILVAIQTNTKGFVLVDEVDSGIHYTKLESLWSVLRAFSELHQTQLFVSTHSWECLKALLPTIKKHESDFRLVHCTRTDKGCVPRLIAGPNMRAAIEEGIELR